VECDEHHEGEQFWTLRRRMPNRETKRYLAELGKAIAGEEIESTAHGEPAKPGHNFNKPEYFSRSLPAEATAVLVENRHPLAGQRTMISDCTCTENEDPVDGEPVITNLENRIAGSRPQRGCLAPPITATS
jgi:hypothetical protein